MLKRWELENNTNTLLGCRWQNPYQVFPFGSQLRQSQTELEKVKEATDNFKKMM